MAATTAKRRGAAKPKPVPAQEPEVDELEELEEDEVEETEEEVEEPASKKTVKKTSKKAAPAKAEKKAEAPTNGTQWLAEHVNKVLGTEYKAYDLRVMLRKLAKDGTLQREVGNDRSRYDFSGPNDPVVKAVIAKLRDGDLEKEKKAKLNALKDRKSKKAKASTEDDEVGEELTDEDEDVDELDDDE